MENNQSPTPPLTVDHTDTTAITARCRDCGTTLWSKRYPTCGACGSRKLQPLLEEYVDRSLTDESETLVAVVVITRDAKGDFWFRDTLRDGLLCDATSETEGFELFQRVRADYDEVASPAKG